MSRAPALRTLPGTIRLRAAMVALAAIAAALPASMACGFALRQGAAPPAQAPPSVPPPSAAPAAEQLPGLASVEEIRKRLEALRAIESPNEEDKARVDRLVQALDLIGKAEANRERAAGFREGVAQLQPRLERIRAQQLSIPTVPEDAGIEQLDQALKLASAELAAARDAVAQVDSQLAQLAERRRMLPEEVGRTRSAVAEALQEVEKVPAPPPGTPDTTRQLALARFEERTAAALMLDAELDSLGASAEVLAAQREVAQRRLDAADALAKRIRTDLDARRKDEVERARGDAGPAADPRVAQAITQNARLAERLEAVGQLVADLTDQASRREAELTRLSRDFETDRERSRVAGTSGQLSELLRRQRQALPSPRELAADAAKLRATRAEIDLERIDRTVELETLIAEESALREAPDQGAAVAEVLRTQRVTFLNPLRDKLDEASAKAAALEGLDAKVAEVVTEYRDFIDQRVLWLRSGPTIWSVGAAGFESAFQAITSTITSASEWRAVRRQLELEHLWAYAGLGLAALLLLLRPLIRRWLDRLGAEVARGRTDRFVLTIEAMIATVGMSMAAPAAMVGLGLALRSNEVGSALVQALAAMLLSGSLWVALLLFSRRLVRRQGLAADHFGWRRDQIECLHQVSSRLFRFTTPLVLAAVFCARLPEMAGGRVIAGLLFIPCQLMLAWAGWRLFSPGSGLYAAHIAQHPQGWISRLRWIWVPLVVGVPIVAAVLTLVGWSYTSGVLVNKLVQSAALGLGVAVLEGIMLRGLEFAARAFAARSREQVLAVPQGMEAAAAVQKETVRNEIAAGSRQTRMTIRAISIAVLLGGFAIIWSDLLPALRFFDTVELWKGASAPVTVASLLWVLVIGCVALFAARNLPGAVEVLVLQHTGMTPAGRYAATAVMRYSIVIVAVMMVGGRIGLEWSSVQWLVAAVSVGLGFGLQEIVGNFIAGLILLFEQPVRVGDVVTVGDRTGQVVKIRIRSTTIRDPDGKDLIIPNKHLITERVVNWTLSGAPLRLVLPLGVAYGTDLALAERLLRDAAATVPAILATPPSTPQLMGFGANSIDFEMRVFVARIDQLMPTRHALMIAIQSTFGDAGITIAFPQLDVHVDTGALERLIKEVQR